MNKIILRTSISEEMKNLSIPRQIKLTKKGSVSVLDASGRKEELIVTSLPKLQ